MQPLEFSKLSGEDQKRLTDIGYDAPVYHIGKQWAVTGYGIEEVRSDAAHNPYYHIPVSDLDMDLGVSGWPAHMAEKTWVDHADFMTAFDLARKVHRP